MSIQTKVGWRPYVNLTSVQAAAYLLDSYSGAAAAYSLRKLKSSYTGSAIRVRRSSDNTESNIGFDSDGNLDTVALSVFVGTGNGFVTTWYDQSGSGNNATQTTSSSQPRIVNAGIIETVGGKPAVRWLVTGGLEMVLSMNTSLSNVRSVFLNITYLSGIARVPLLGHTTAYDYHSDADVYLSSQYAANYVKNGSNYINGVSKTLATFVKSSSNSLITMIHTSASGNVNQISSDRNIGRWDWSFFTGYFSEIILYSSDQTTNRINIESNINTYYSIYPNPTSVWNLLNAVYSADTTALPSLKTSLVAAYNGESNANDSKGTNNGTAVGGLTYTTGKIGNAFDFNGTNSYISIPNTSGQLNFTGDFSISTWVMPLVTSAGYVLYFSNFLSSGSGYNFYLDRTNNTLQLYMAGGGNYSRYEYSWTPLVNTWYHLVLTRKGSTGTKFYINGTEAVGTYSGLGATFNPSFQSGQIYNIGSTLNGSGLANYRQDATTLWQKELTASEIIELYNSGNGAQYIGDNFYKPTTNDALNTNNGTAVGGLTYGLGKVGTAFVGNGTNAYVSLPNTSGQFNFAGDFSVSMWFRSSDISTSRYAIGNYKSGGSYYGYGWSLYYSQAGGFAFDLRNGNNINQVRKIQTINTNTWYHVVAVRKMGQIHKLYVNGIDTLAPQTDGNVNNIAGYTTNQPMNLGGLSDINLPALCDLDGVNMWNRELSASEITELYNSGNGKQYPN